MMDGILICISCKRALKATKIVNFFSMIMFISYFLFKSTKYICILDIQSSNTLFNLEILQTPQDTTIKIIVNLLS